MNQGTHTSEIWITATGPSSPQYPDLRFSCMQCGSLDVFISKETTKLKMRCLDCSETEEIQ